MLVIPPLPTNMTMADSHEVNRVKLVGLISNYVTKQAKAGKRMALLNLEKTFGPYYSLPVSGAWACTCRPACMPARRHA